MGTDSACAAMTETTAAAPWPSVGGGDEHDAVFAASDSDHAGRGFFSPIARGVSAAIALVSLVVLVLSAVVTWAFARDDVATLSADQEAGLGQALSAAIAASYATDHYWRPTEINAILTLAAQHGIEAKITDQSGTLVATTVPPAGEQFRSDELFPIRLESQRIGTAAVRVGPNGIGATDAQFRHDLFDAIAWTAIGAALLALLAGVVVGRRITRPVAVLNRAIRALAAGDMRARTGTVANPGELASLASAFDAMADSLERESELRRALVADIAHELRTPLAVLQASTEAMLDGVRPVNRETLSSVHEKTLRLGRLVSDLEVLASADAAEVSMRRSPVALADVVTEVVEFVQPQARAGGIRLSTRLEPACVLGDEARLHQIVLNLLSNAIKFTPPGGWIIVTLEPRGGQVHLQVADNGTGISAEDVPHVFERFWRSRSARGISGSGIGLAVVTELVHAHGGHVSVSSDGEGSRFEITMPVNMALPTG